MCLTVCHVTFIQIQINLLLTFSNRNDSSLQGFAFLKDILTDKVEFERKREKINLKNRPAQGKYSKILYLAYKQLQKKQQKSLLMTFAIVLL